MADDTPIPRMLPGVYLLVELSDGPVWLTVGEYRALGGDASAFIAAHNAQATARFNRATTPRPRKRRKRGKTTGEEMFG